MEDAPKYEVGKLMELLARLSSIFDSSHYYCMEVKRRIIENIGIYPREYYSYVEWYFSVHNG